MHVVPGMLEGCRGREWDVKLPASRAPFPVFLSCQLVVSLLLTPTPTPIFIATEFYLF